MNRILTIGAVILFLSLSFAGNSHAGSLLRHNGFREYDSTKLVGSMVKSLDGEDLGRILNLEIDSQGRVDFAMVVEDGFEEFPGRFVAVPFSNLTVSEGRSAQIQVTLNADKEDFFTAPDFNAKDLDNRQRVTEMYRHFGEEPYWTEEGTEKAATNLGQYLCLPPYSLLNKNKE
jgi:hypothetical protein